jgi:hypothetical protein
MYMVEMFDFSTHIYDEIKSIYSNNIQNKHLVLDTLAECFENNINPTTLYKLKVLMETRFIRDINCKYTYLFTPEQCGCDLRELIFNIETEPKRSRLLKNIHLKSAQLNQQIPHILTDIDDTIFPNYNGIIETMGSDTSWKSRKLYPGIAKFYERFYKNLQIKESRYSTVLTGTPVFLKNNRLYNTQIQTALGPNFGFIQGFDNKRTTLNALLTGLVERPFYNLAISSTQLAEIKFKKFIQYKEIFPEYKLLIIGDNGQGDLTAGLKMLDSDPNCYVFIHNILKFKTKFLFSDNIINSFKHDRLFFFKNYLELSVKFAQLGYLKISDLFKIQNSIKSELKKSYLTDKCPQLYEHYNSNQIPKILRISLC